MTTKAQNAYAGSTPMANATAAAVQKKPEQEAPPPQPKKEAPKRPPISPEVRERASEHFEKELRRYLRFKKVSSVEELPFEERITLSEFKKMVEERGLIVPLFIAGGSEADKINVNDFSHEGIKNIIREINQRAERIGEDQNLPPQYLQDKLDRVRRLMDQGEFGAAYTNEALRFIDMLEQRIDIAHRAGVNGEDAEEDIDGRRESKIEEMVRKEMAVPLKKSETRTFNPAKFTDREVQAIANEVDRALSTEREATHGYLTSKIAEVSRIIKDLLPRQTDPDIRRRVEQLEILNADIQELNNVLWAKIAEARGDTLHGLYGEIRPSPAQTRINIQNAIDSILSPDPQKRELAASRLDLALNNLFTRANINSNSDWKEALGSAGQIEFDLFFTGLGNAASHSTLPLGHELTQEEKDAINQKIRELRAQAEYREFFHNLNYYINRNANLEEMHGVMKRFPAESIDQAYSIAGVTQMDHFLEQAMFQVMAENAGYIPYEAMVVHPDGTPGRVEELVMEMAKDAKKTGILSSGMQPWELQRAFSLARGLRIANGRALEIVAQGGIPRDTPLDSWWANNIIKKLAFFRQVARYNIGFERNRVLAYKLESPSFFWSLRELAVMETKDIIKRMTVESNDDRYMDMINPMNIGGIKTQTGWRYGKDLITNAGVISELLRNYDYNPLIGGGMWIEKERKNLVPTERDKPIDKREATIAELKRTFRGKEQEIDKLKTKGELARFIIGENLDLAGKTVPLKLFYNLKGVRQQVLAKYAVDPEYEGQIEVFGETGDIKTDIKEGQIKIKEGSALNKDLQTLALAQERLQQKRVDAYLEWDKNGKDLAQRPDLYRQFTDLEAEIREVCRGLSADRSDQVIELANNIRSEFNNRDYGKEKLLDNLKDKGWKVPYIFGEDDIPQHLYRYGKSGGSSAQRRWGDMESADKAAGKAEEFIMNLTMFRTQDDIIKGLNDIYQTLRGHDEGAASEFIFRLSEGVIKFYKKEAASRLPFGIGTLKGFIGGKTSYAELIYGREQMSWDEIDIDAFIKRLHAAALLGPHEDAEERIKRLRKHTGARWWNLFLISGPRTLGGLGIIGFIIYMISKTTPDEYKKAA